MPRPARRLALLTLAGLVAAGCGMDAAAMVDAGTSPVTAQVGDLRVLRHRDDPTAGDRWVDVLEADPAVFERTGTFREEGSRTAEPDEAADARLLYEAIAPGSTLVVRMDCRGCGPDGVPTTRPEDTRLLVWELRVDGGDEPTFGPRTLAAREVTDVEVGDHVVVVEPDERLERGVLPADSVLRLVATQDEPRLDVYAVVAEGRGAAVYGPAGELTYPVRARRP
ncbi:MAG TPA: hypothetical protein VFV42_11930 [Acidimicrobiales bacterium]|nr:hypothetical protein [Acidimicrobiales bacterium]